MVVYGTLLLAILTIFDIWCFIVAVISSQILCMWVQCWYFVLFCVGEQLGEFLDSLNLPTKQYVFLPVNDNEQCEQTGGSHWCVSTATIHSITVNQLSLFHYLLSVNCHQFIIHCQLTVIFYCQSTVTIHSITVNQLSSLHHLLSINCHHFIIYCQSHVNILSITVNQLSPLHHVLLINCHNFIIYYQSTVTIHSIIVNQLSTITISLFTLSQLSSFHHWLSIWSVHCFGISPKQWYIYLHFTYFFGCKECGSYCSYNTITQKGYSKVKWCVLLWIHKSWMLLKCNVISENQR